MSDIGSLEKNQITPEDMITNKKSFFHDFLCKLGIRYLIQSSLVIILFVTIVVVILNDIKKCNTRDEAFKQITSAEKSSDFIGIIQGAERFFSMDPLTERDQRELYVKELYDKAIVRLFAEQNEQLDAEALKHFKRYRQLIVDQGK